MKIHHIGYAVHDINKSVEEFKKLGFYEESETYRDEGRHVLIKFLNNGIYRIELLSPINRDKSPVDNILDKIGPTPYHICYEVTDIAKAVAEFRERGYIIISNPSIAIAIDNRKVVFLYNREIGIVELVEHGND